SRGCDSTRLCAGWCFRTAPSEPEPTGTIAPARRRAGTGFRTSRHQTFAVARRLDLWPGPDRQFPFPVAAAGPVGAIGLWSGRTGPSAADHLDLPGGPGIRI